jgi:hypothetical protein
MTKPDLKIVTDDWASTVPTLKGGDGGGTSDGMEARVKRLEDDMSEVSKDLKAIRVDLAYIKGKLEGMPSATAFGELKGRVDSLPTMAKAATMLGIAVAAITILNNWEAVRTVFSVTP